MNSYVFAGVVLLGIAFIAGNLLLHYGKSVSSKSQTDDIKNTVREEGKKTRKAYDKKSEELTDFASAAGKPNIVIDPPKLNTEKLEVIITGGKVTPVSNFAKTDFVFHSFLTFTISHEIDITKITIEFKNTDVKVAIFTYPNGDKHFSSSNSQKGWYVATLQAPKDGNYRVDFYSETQIDNATANFIWNGQVIKAESLNNK